MTLAWQPQAFEDPFNFAFPAANTFIRRNGGLSQICAPSVFNTSSGGLVFEFDVAIAGGGQYCYGFITASTVSPSLGNVRNNYGSIGNCAWVAEAGYCFNNATYTGTQLANVADGSKLIFYINPAATGWAASFDGNTWNGSYSTTQILAGTGLFTLGFSGPFVPFVSLTGSNPTITILSDSSQTLPAPSGAGYLDQNALLSVQSVTSPNGSALSLVWASTVAITGGLQVSVDGGAFADMSGTVTGTGGTATGPTISDNAFHTLVIQQTTAPLTASFPFQFENGSFVEQWQTTTVGPGSTGITLSNANLTATFPASSSAKSLVVSNRSFLGGTHAATFTFNGANDSSNLVGCGIIQNGYNDTNGLLGDWSAGAACVATSMQYRLQINNSGSPVFTFPNVNSSGDQITVVVNNDAGLFWAKIGNGPWCGNPAAYITNDPAATAAATGGYSLGNLVQPYSWCVGMYQTDAGPTSFDVVFNDVVQFLTITSVSVDSGTNVATVNWAATETISGGLHYTLNSLPLVTADAFPSGLSGSFTVPWSGKQGLNTLQISDGVATPDVSNVFYYSTGSSAPVWATTSLGCGSAGMVINADGTKASTTSTGSPSQVVSSAALPTTGSIKARFYFFGNPAHQGGVGIISSDTTNTSDITGNTGLGAVVALTISDGAIYFNGASESTGLGSVSSGDYFDLTYNADAKLFWAQRNGGPLNGNTSAQISYSATATAADTGGIDISALTGSLFWAVGWHSLTAGDSFIADFGIPTLKLSNINARSGSPTSFRWESSQALSSLLYSLDGNPWQPCTGVIAGGTGFGFGPTISDTLLHTLEIVSGITGLSNSLVATFIVAPEGAGSPLGYLEAVNILGSSFSGTLTEPLSAGQFVYSFSGSVQPYATNGNTTGTPGAVLSFTKTSDSSTFQVQVTSNGWGGSINPYVTVAPTSATPSGSTSLPMGSQDFSITGTFVQSPASGGNSTLAYTADSLTGTTLFYTYGFAGNPGFVLNAISIDDGGAGAIFEASNIVNMRLALYNYPLESEVLTLTSASYSNGTISTAGSCSGATLTAVNLSLDAGSTFESSTTETIASDNSYTASLVTSLSYGTYYVQAEDATTGQISNIQSIVVAPESMTLTSAAGTIGSLLTFGGVTNNGTSSAIDLAVNGTWGDVTDYVVGSGTTNVTFSGKGPTVSASGTLVLQARDHTDQTIISNLYTLVVAPSITITLTTATGRVGGTLSLTGILNGGLPPLNVSFDGSVSNVRNFTDDGVVPDTGWAGSGSTLSTAGTFPTFVYDSDFPTIVSNTVNAVIARQETIEITNASGTLNGVLSIGGVIDSGPASAVNVSVNGGATFYAGTDFSTTTTGTNDVFSVNGITLTSYGTYNLVVQDATNTGVESPPFPFVLAPSGVPAPLSEFLYPKTGPYAGKTPTATIIPLQNFAQQFTISLAGVTYGVQTYWDSINSTWVMDISDASGNALIQGIPLTTGTDLLEQYQYVGIGGAMFVLSQGSDVLAAPTLDNLGSNAQLYFVTYS